MEDLFLDKVIDKLKANGDYDKVDDYLACSWHLDQARLYCEVDKLVDHDIIEAQESIQGVLGRLIIHAHAQALDDYEAHHATQEAIMADDQLMSKVMAQPLEDDEDG